MRGRPDQGPWDLSLAGPGGTTSGCETQGCQCWISDTLLLGVRSCCLLSPGWLEVECGSEERGEAQGRLEHPLFPTSIPTVKSVTSRISPKHPEQR